MVLLYFESILKSGNMKNMHDQIGNQIYDVICWPNIALLTYNNYVVRSVDFVIDREDYIVYLPIGNNDLQALLEDI